MRRLECVVLGRLECVVMPAVCCTDSGLCNGKAGVCCNAGVCCTDSTAGLELLI